MNISSIPSEIFSDNTTEDELPLIIDRHVASTEFIGVSYYYELMKELTKSKSYRSYIEQNHVSVDVCASIGGEVLYLQTEASQFEPVAIIGPSQHNVNAIIAKLKTFENEITEEFGPNLELYIDTLKKNKIEIIWRGRFTAIANNSPFFVSYITRRVWVGDKVGKDERILSIEQFDISARTMNCFYKYMKAANYCRVMINHLNNKTQPPKKTKEETKSKKLKQVWKGSTDEYNAAITFLSQEYRFGEIDLPFIVYDEDEEKYYWHKQVSQKYLAAFILLCIERKYIREDYTAPELVKICKNTFIHDTLDKNNFTSIKINEKIEDKFKEPFLNLFPKSTTTPKPPKPPKTLFSL